MRRAGLRSRTVSRKRIFRFKVLPGFTAAGGFAPIPPECGGRRAARACPPLPTGNAFGIWFIAACWRYPCEFCGI